MSIIKVATIHNPAEFVISIIKQNCFNIDDLSKIAVAVECLMEELSTENEPPTLKQLLAQSS